MELLLLLFCCFNCVKNLNNKSHLFTSQGEREREVKQGKIVYTSIGEERVKHIKVKTCQTTCVDIYCVKHQFTPQNKEQEEGGK